MRPPTWPRGRRTRSGGLLHALRRGLARAGRFHIVTRWELAAPPRAVVALLSEPERFPDWWGEVYLGVRILEPGRPDGIGRIVEMRSRGFLPYRLVWRGRLVAWRPDGCVIAAMGDLRGRGVWRIRPYGTGTLAIYDWRVRVERPLLRRLAPLLGPAFAWNHRWAMARGARALTAELARRSADGAAMPAGLAAIEQIMIEQHASHHRLGHRHGADADAGIVAPLGNDFGGASVDADRAARAQDR